MERLNSFTSHHPFSLTGGGFSIGSEHMKITEEEYKQLCAKCEYLIKTSGKRVCPFAGCIKSREESHESSTFVRIKADEREFDA